MEFKTSSSTAWQEFGPLTGITSQIPSHYQHGFQTSELVLTCLSSFEDHIVLGTNVGLIYLSHLPTLHTVRLKCENTLDSISCVSAIRSVEDLIAVGSKNGCVSLFLLPRLLAPLNSTAPAPRAGLGQNQKRFSVSSLHCSQITCLSWSSNGLRVVSGDVEGTIALLELDHNSGQCVGRHLHRELAPVVQLQYWKQAVAVSTTQRCLVYSLTKGTVCGVGSRGRKEGGRYGVAWRRRAGTTDPITGGMAATDAVTEDLFNKTCIQNVKDVISATITVTTSDSTTSEAGPCSTSTSTATISTRDTSSSNQSLLYTSRPGQRLWLADCEGTVHSTLLIKDIPAQKRIEVVLSGNSASGTHFSQDSAVLRFETVNELDTGQLVMHSSDSLIVFNPITLQVETFIYCEDFIKDLSIHGQCIFILDKQCCLHYLSAKPIYIGSSSVNRNSAGITADPLVSPALLRKFGSHVYSQGSSLLDSVVKIGGAIASKVSETAAGGVIVTGSSELPRGSHYSRNLQGAGLNTVTKTGFVAGPGYQSPSPLSGSGAGNAILDTLLEGEGRNSLAQDQREDAEPLVIMGRVKSKPKRKTGSGPASPTYQSSSSRKSSVLGDSPPISGTPNIPSINTASDSPAAIVPSQQDDSCYQGGSMHSDLECERRIGAILDIECLKNAGLDGDTTLTSCAGKTLISSGHFASCDIGSGNKWNKNGVNSRDIDKMKHDDEFCNNDIVTTNSRVSDETNSNNRDVRRIDLPINYHSGLNVSEQFFAQNNSLDSNVSLCYGPPSGSSVPSLQSITSVQGLPHHACTTSSLEQENSSASLSLDFQPHTSTAACSTTVTVPGQRGDALQQESEAWLVMTLPTVVRSFSVSDNMLVLLDRQGCLYLGQLNHGNMTCAWSKTELPLPVAAVSVSASGSTLWLLDESKHAYACKRLDGTTDRSDRKQVSGHGVLCRMDNVTQNVGDDARLGQSCREIYLLNTSPIASRVLELCGDDTIQFCIKDDNQVYCLQQGCPEVPLHSDGSGKCVALSYRAGLLWALDDDRRLLFRTGQAKRNPGGHAWGAMTDCNGNGTHATVGDSDVVEGGRYCDLTATSTADTDKVIVDIVPADTNIISNNEDNSGSRDPAPVPSSPASASNLAMCVGSSGVGWREEEEASLFFRPGISRGVPQGANTEWWQIASPPEGLADSGTDRRVFLASSSHHLWRAESGKDCVAVHPAATTGVWWQCVGSARWSVVSAEALYAVHGCIACLSSTGGLHLLCPHTGRHEPVPLPDDSPAVCVCQRPEALWLLTAAGALWVRAGLTQADTKGTSWHLLDLHQISDAHLCHLSLGMEVVWAVDTRGGVYMREGVLTPPPPTASTCAWLQVQDTPLSGGAVFSKVFAGPDRRLVWALDSLRRVYVRVAIFTDLPIGVAWEPVEGLRALHLSISEDGLVFALCESGAVYRREGVRPPHNYVGTHWTRLPGILARLSVSVDGRLWGLRQDGRLCRHVSLHSVRDVPRPRLPVGVTREEGLAEEEEEENGWEVV